MATILENFIINFWEGRSVPPILKTILHKDEIATKKIRHFSKNFDNNYTRRIFKLLEFTASFPMWLLFWIVYGCKHIENLNATHRNLLIGIVLDIIITTALKLMTARKRPAPKTTFGAVGSRIFSFPSGHASRAAYVTYFFTILVPVSASITYLLLIWIATLALSRILLERHYLLDVVGGLVSGIAIGVVIGCTWDSHLYKYIM